ncbi:MAG: hypothetical protein RSF13_09125, partial [Clostridiales bacterium]
GVEIPDDKKAEIDKAVLSNYKTVAEVGNITAKLNTAKTDLIAANGKVTELGNKIKGLEGTSDELETLKNKVSQYEAAEQARLDAEKETQNNSALLATFEEATKEKTFVNDFTKNAIFESCKSELAKNENKGKGINDIFIALTTDKEGIFANPNPGVDIPGVGKAINNGTLTREQIKTMSTKEINERWSDVATALEGAKK